jgi:hypothetical protein
VNLAEKSPEDKVNTLIQIANLQARKDPMNDAEATLRQALNLTAKLPTETRNQLLPQIVTILGIANKSALLPSVIASIPDAARRKVAQQQTGCLF